MLQISSDPVGNGVRAVQAVPEGEGVVAVAAVPAHEGFDAVAVGDDESGGEHDLGGVLQVALGDEIFEAVNFADGDGQHQHHGEAGVDGARDEVGREDGGVPSGDDADGEVEADDGVNREHQRRGQSGEQQVHGFVAMPVAGRSAPSEGEHAVDNLQRADCRCGRAAWRGRG